MFDDEPDEEAFRFVQVPPDDYQIDVYAYFPSFTGVAESLTASFMGCDYVPVGQWFRETHSGEDYPPWIIYQCLESYDADPENEVFWAEYQESMDDAQEEALRSQAGKYVEFLVHLTPLVIDPPPLPEH